MVPVSRAIVGSASWLIALVSSLVLISAQASARDRLADIEARGTLNCGIWPEVPGFALVHNHQVVGFDVDTCRAVAAAIFGDAGKVRFVTLASIAQFTERQDVDLVIRRLTWRPSREAANHIAFGPVTFYDGLGFLVTKDSAIRGAAELAGGRICVRNREHQAETLADYFRGGAHLVLVETDQQAQEALRDGRCRAYSADVSWLAAVRSSFVDGVARYDILPDLISKEPLAPLLRMQDTELLQLVRWTIFAMIDAEELGLNSRNIGSEPRSSRVRSFLKIHPDWPVALGAGDWVRAIIAQVGNYGEVFDRNLGAGSAIKLDRGLNRLWTQGGLLYAPPLERRSDSRGGD